MDDPTHAAQQAPRRPRLILLVGFAGGLAAIALLLLAAPPAAAAIELTFAANITPMTPTEGEEFRVDLAITNTNTTTPLTNVQVIVLQGQSIFRTFPQVTIPPNQTYYNTFTAVAERPGAVDAERGLTFRVQSANSLITYGEATYPAFRVLARPPPPPPSYILPLAVAGVGGGGALVAFLVVNRRKQEAARLAAEAAAKSAVERRAAAEAARELAATQKVHGKYPPEYFLRRRARLAVLVPEGLTSAGITVLARRVKVEAKVVYSCQRCGTHKESFEAPCPRCTVQDGIDALRGEVRKHRTGADMSDVGNLLQQAEFQLSYSSFGEAQALVDQGRQVFNEILAGGERTIEVKRLETITAGDAKPKLLDLGLGTEHTAVDTEREEQEYETREEYAREGTHCPTCGHAMYGEMCAFCHFDDYARLVEDAVGLAAKAGADTVEPRDLLERARKLREEDNKSTGSRYLNRARYLATKHAHDTLASRAEGMIDYARTLMLVGDEDGIVADFAQAEATVAQADAKRQADDPGAAVELVAKAEEQIHAALHELARKVAIKRIDAVASEADDARGKGVKVDAADAKLKDARAAFDAGDFEQARDTATEARKAIEEAAKGKTACPKCGKPVQPTWARCPFCTTPLK